MMSNAIKEKSPGQRRGWMKLALVLSLAINLAVLGAVAGAFWRNGSERSHGLRGPGSGAFGAPYMLALPSDDRRAVLQAVRAASGGHLQDRRARRAQFQEVLLLLRTQPYDATALSDALSQQAQASVAIQQQAQSAWLDVVSAMNDEERSAYADTLERILARGPKHR